METIELFEGAAGNLTERKHAFRSSDEVLAFISPAVSV